jgi:aminotransferase
MGIGPGDDVVLPAYVCGTLLDGVLAAGAHPVFMDVAPDLNPTAETTAAAITPRTRCVIVPHLFGRAAPVDEIEAMLAGRGIRLMDDAAQSFGARRNGRMIGSFGDVGIVAIGAGKSLAGPAGGVLVTNDPEVHARAKALADSLPVESYGSVARRLTEYWLWRRWRRFTFAIMVVWERLARPVAAPHVAARMANVDAAIGLAQLRRLEANAARRRSNADALARALGDAARWSITDRSADGTQVKFTLVVPPEGPTATEVMIALARAGIETQRGYAPCVPPDGERTALPETDAIWQRVVCLPTETTLRDARTLASFAAARPSTAQASAR